MSNVNSAVVKDSAEIIRIINSKFSTLEEIHIYHCYDEKENKCFFAVGNYKTSGILYVPCTLELRDIPDSNGPITYIRRCTAQIEMTGYLKRVREAVVINLNYLKDKIFFDDNKLFYAKWLIDKPDENEKDEEKREAEYIDAMKDYDKFVENNKKYGEDCVKFLENHPFEVWYNKVSETKYIKHQNVVIFDTVTTENI